MEMVANDRIKQEFIKGKSLLDEGRHEESIKIFDELIEISISEVDSYEDNLTLHTSLNNRGIAKCKLGETINDKTLYMSGVNDLKKAVVLFGLSDNSLKPQAAHNLSKAESVIKVWGASYADADAQSMFKPM